MDRHDIPPKKANGAEPDARPLADLLFLSHQHSAYSQQGQRRRFGDNGDIQLVTLIRPLRRRSIIHEGIYSDKLTVYQQFLIDAARVEIPVRIVVTSPAGIGIKTAGQIPASGFRVIVS